MNDELSEFDSSICQFEPGIRQVSESNVSRKTVNNKQQQQREQPTSHDRQISKKSHFFQSNKKSQKKIYKIYIQLYATNQEVSSPIFHTLE